MSTSVQSSVPRYEEASCLPVGMEERVLTRVHWRLAFTLGAGIFFGALASAGILPFLMLAVTQYWHLTSTQVGWLGFISVAGGVFGGIILGSLADRWGRKRVLIASVILLGLANGFCAVSPDYGTFLIFRFLVGFGLAGQLTTTYALLSELSPSKYRGTLTSLTQAFWPTGCAAAAVMAYWIIPAISWRAICLCAVAPAFYALHMYSVIPESRRVIISKTPLDSLDMPNSVLGVGRQYSMSDRVFCSGIDLWRHRLGPSTLVLWILCFVTQYVYMGMNLWIPTLLVNWGYTVRNSLLYSIFISLGQIPAFLASLWLLDRWGRKPTFLTLVFACAITCIIFGFSANSPTSVLGLGILVLFFSRGANGVTDIMVPEYYPTQLRAKGAGWARGIAQIGGALAPLVIGWIQQNSVIARALTFGHLAGFCLIGFATMLLLGRETMGLQLES